MRRRGLGTIVSGCLLLSSVATASAAAAERVQDSEDHELESLSSCCHAPDPAQRLADELADLGIPDELLAEPAWADPGAPDVMPLLGGLLARAATAPRDRAAPLLLAADRVAAHLAFRFTPEPRRRLGRRDAARLDSLRALGIGLSFNLLAGGWDYDHALLVRLWREFPDTEWGHVAYLHLLERSLWSGVSCPGPTTDLFHQVIERGEAYLAQRPGSAYRALVSFWLAQAYETWWSLGSARNDQYVSDPGIYAEGMEGSRRAAMMLYGTVAEIAPDGALARYAADRRRALADRADTGQRRFYCIYD